MSEATEVGEKRPRSIEADCSKLPPFGSSSAIRMGKKKKNNGRALRSGVWDDFNKVKNKATGEKHAICLHCNKKFSGNSNAGTTHLWKHLNCCPYLARSGESSKSTQKQATLSFVKKETGELSLSTWKYNQNNVRRAIEKMIIVHEYPLSIVEHEEFRNAFKEAQPLFKPWSRNTAKADIMMIYREERKPLKMLLQQINGRVAITTDMWTCGGQKRGFMAITAHYIDDNWKLHNRLLRFVVVATPHTSERLCKVLVKSLAKLWNIDRRLSCVTLDNCTTNEKLIDLLVDKLHKPSLILNGELLHLCCSAHVLNLIVKDGPAIISPFIHNVRESVAYWTATPKRVETFTKVAKRKAPEATRKLCSDCQTRWNSTYKMLASALPYQVVFEALGRQHKGYKWAPSEEDWVLAKDICQRFKVFCKITELFSGSRYPTANIFFSKLCEIRLELRKWVSSENVIVKSMSTEMIKKFDKYWCECHGILTVATVLDPRYKLKFVRFMYCKIFGEQVGIAETEKVYKLMVKVVADYEKRSEKASGYGKAIEVYNPAFVGDDDPIDEFDRTIGQECLGEKPKTDLDFYLEDGLEPRDKNQEFDILGWWKICGVKFSVLDEMARDILAVLVTSVAFESAFSSSGRVLQPYRLKLTSKIVEALMCSQSWIKNDHSTQGVAKYATIMDDDDINEELEDSGPIVENIDIDFDDDDDSEESDDDEMLECH